MSVIHSMQTQDVIITREIALAIDFIPAPIQHIINLSTRCIEVIHRLIHR